MKLGFIGAGGNMAGAIIDSILENNLSNDLYLYDVNLESLEKFKGKATVLNSELEVAKEADIVFLCVKPQVVFTVLEKLADSTLKDKCFVSIVAGVTIDKIENALGFDAKIIRVMPNTPLLVSSGAAGVCKNKQVSSDEFDFVLSVFSSSGIAKQVDESLMDAVTAVSGSGPAYVYRFMKCMTEQGIEMGLDAETAYDLALHTIIGAAEMMKKVDKTTDEIQTLIDKVTSPNGTTYAALMSMNETGFDKSVKDALIACRNRSKELSNGK